MFTSSERAVESYIKHFAPTASKQQLCRVLERLAIDAKHLLNCMPMRCIR